MSNEENREANGSDRADAVCRDFLRNVCRRGVRCKYTHPDTGDTDEKAKQDYVFCHDYQNKECTRPNCKFLHCSRQEEEYYRITGKLPQHALESISLGRGLAESSGKGEIPVCKDYLKGDCRRLGRCKFRHLTLAEYNEEMPFTLGAKREFETLCQYDSGYGIYEPDLKRRALDGHFPQIASIVPPQPFHTDYRMLEEENILLRRKVEELKKQVADLTATNEFLLDQNAQLRLSKQTTTVSPITQALIASIPQPITQMSQQLPMNSDLSAAAPGQATIPPQAQSIVPVTLGQALAPVSITPVSISQALPDQTIPQNIITMSGTTTTLVSYPIMTQSMRSAIPHSLVP